MSWWLWGLAVVVALRLAGALYRWTRNTLVDQEDIRYHYGSWLARTAARMRGSHNNYAVTLGRHTFVRMAFIRQKHAAHEFKHSLQADRHGGFAFLCRALWEYARHGYTDSPIEVEARAYADANEARFRDYPPHA